MSQHVVVEVGPTSVAPVRFVGEVTKDKTGDITVAYKELGMVKLTQRRFQATDVVAAKTGEAGFVVAMVNDPIAKFSGVLATAKDGRQFVKTEDGNIELSSNPGATVKVTLVEENSKEARAATRAAKVKGVRRKTTAPATGTTRGRKATTSTATAKRGRNKTASAEPTEKSARPKRRRKAA